MALTLNNDLSKLKVGDYFWCKYTVTTSGQVGTFSDIATKTDAEAIPVIPVPTLSDVTTGYFKYIVVDDYNGKIRLIADRGIQRNISWDTLNTIGIASGSGLPTLFDVPKPENYAFSTRLLTGGTSTTDKDNEWDKYLVNSTLGGTITAWDDNVWNWSGGRWSWTSTVHTTSTNRVYRGNGWNYNPTSYVSSIVYFRPALEIESLFTLLNKSFILFGDGYKKLSESIDYGRTKDITPIMTSKNTPSPFVVTESSIYGAVYEGWNIFSSVVGSRWMSLNAVRPNGGHWVAIDFYKPVIVSKIEIKTQSVYGNDVGLKNFDLYGSNDSVNYKKISSHIQLNSAEIQFHETGNKDFYRCYRINTLDNYSTVNSPNLNTISMLNFYAYPVIPPSWKIVSPTLPTLSQFQGEGIDDLSIFDRKVQQVLESPQAMTDSVLGVGKVFKGTVNLNKYFDLRKLEVK